MTLIPPQFNNPAYQPRIVEIRPFYKQHLAYQYLWDHETNFLLYGGGAGGGKSWLGCEWLVTSSMRYPGIKSFIARERLKTLKNTTLITFQKVCRNFGFKRNVDYKINLQDSYIEFTNGSRIDLLEVKYNPSDPLYEDLGSSEYTFGWLEEGGEIHFNAFDTLKSRVGRHMNDQYNLHRKILITCNPKKNWLYNTFYLPWKKGTLMPGYAFLQSLHGDNTKNEKGYAEALNDIKDPVRRQRLIQGVWEYEAEAGTFFDYDAVSDLWTNTIKETVDKYLTVDVARKGQDKTVLYFWRGLNLYKKQVYTNQGTDITALRIKEAARAEKIPYSNILADEDGVGGGVIDQCKGIQGFLNNSSPLPNKDSRYEDLEPQNFSNLKTQCAYMMAQRVNRHEVVITIEDPETEFIEEFEQELAVYREKTPFDDMKKIALIGKDEMKQELGRSPDYGDAFIMRAWFMLKKNYRPETAEEHLSKEINRLLGQQSNDAGDFLFRPGME